MTEDEGLSLAEAVQWCGEGLNRREATRLRALMEETSDEGAVTAPITTASGG